MKKFVSALISGLLLLVLIALEALGSFGHSEDQVTIDGKRPKIQIKSNLSIVGSENQDELLMINYNPSNYPKNQFEVVDKIEITGLMKGQEYTLNSSIYKLNPNYETGSISLGNEIESVKTTKKITPSEDEVNTFEVKFPKHTYKGFEKYDREIRGKGQYYLVVHEIESVKPFQFNDESTAEKHVFSFDSSGNITLETDKNKMFVVTVFYMPFDQWNGYYHPYAITRVNHLSPDSNKYFVKSSEVENNTFTMPLKAVVLAKNFEIDSKYTIESYLYERNSNQYFKIIGPTEMTMSVHRPENGDIEVDFGTLALKTKTDYMVGHVFYRKLNLPSGPYLKIGLPDYPNSASSIMVEIKPEVYANVSIGDNSASDSQMLELQVDEKDVKDGYITLDVKEVLHVEHFPRESTTQYEHVMSWIYDKDKNEPVLFYHNNTMIENKYDTESNAVQNPDRHGEENHFFEINYQDGSSLPFPIQFKQIKLKPETTYTIVNAFPVIQTSITKFNSPVKNYAKGVKKLPRPGSSNYTPSYTHYEINPSWYTDPSTIWHNKDRNDKSLTFRITVKKTEANHQNTSPSSVQNTTQSTDNSETPSLSTTTPTTTTTSTTTSTTTTSTTTSTATTSTSTTSTVAYSSGATENTAISSSSQEETTAEASTTNTLAIVVQTPPSTLPSTETQTATPVTTTRTFEYIELFEEIPLGVRTTAPIDLEEILIEEEIPLGGITPNGGTVPYGGVPPYGTVLPYTFVSQAEWFIGFGILITAMGIVIRRKR